jgi:adenylate kinase
MLNIVLFGPPGAGKGTQALNLIEKYRLIHLSTGDILRGELAARSALGLEAKKYMDKENLSHQNPATNGSFSTDFYQGTGRSIDALQERKKTAIVSWLHWRLKAGADQLVDGPGQGIGRADDQDISAIETGFPFITGNSPGD